MTEEEIMTGVRRPSKDVHPGLDLAAYPSPGMSPAVAPWRSRQAFAADAGARRRWASLSDDETQSPMLWPMRSPVLHGQRGGRRSHSGTPLMGPSAGGIPGLAKVSEHAVAEEVEDFMLPPTPQPQAQLGTSPTSKQVPMTPENFPMAWPNPWESGPMFGCDQAMAAQWQQQWIMRQGDPAWPPPWSQAGGLYPLAPQVAGGFGAADSASSSFGWVPMGAAGAAEISQAQLWLGQEQAAEQMQLSSDPSGSAAPCPLVWVGERAFRASAAAKEQIEGLGYSIKVYRSHDRCSRMLDKKSALASHSVFLVSEADAKPMLQYLWSRSATGVRVLPSWCKPPNLHLRHTAAMRPNDSLLLTNVPVVRRKTQANTAYTFDASNGMLSAAPTPPPLQRSFSIGSLFRSLPALNPEPTPKRSSRRCSEMPSVSMEALLARSSQRRHTDPGRKVQLVFHGTPSSRRPSLIDLSMPLPPVLAPKPEPKLEKEKEESSRKPETSSSTLEPPEKCNSPRASRDTTMTPNSASLASTDDSGGNTPKQVRFRTTITECEVSTPYGVIYDGIRPMDFDFDRWGRKIYHFFPNPEEAEEDDD
ncbi:unnamed protein product [Symbiodinium sp. CCMP2592]|nr:unnamed protein product [Symbiodinium sp. CCMP2592]